MSGKFLPSVLFTSFLNFIYFPSPIICSFKAFIPIISSNNSSIFSGSLTPEEYAITSSSVGILSFVSFVTFLSLSFSILECLIRIFCKALSTNLPFPKSFFFFPAESKFITYCLPFSSIVKLIAFIFNSNIL